MVEDPREKAGLGAVLPIGRPRLVEVKTDGGHWPMAVRMGRRWLVAQVLDRWRIDDEWWRREPVSRACFSVLLEDSYRWIIFQDLIRGKWFRQNLG